MCDGRGTKQRGTEVVFARDDPDGLPAYAVATRSLDEKQHAMVRDRNFAPPTCDPPPISDCKVPEACDPERCGMAT
jgi:hypothetical protein